MPASGASAVLGAFVAVVLATFAARLFDKRGVAIGTGLVAAVDPGLLTVSSDGPGQPLFLALLLAAGFLLLVSVDRPSSTLSFAAGVLTGLAIQARPTALFFAPLLAAPLGDRRWPLRARAHIAAAAILGAVVSLAPWVIERALDDGGAALADDVAAPHAVGLGIGALSAILGLLAARGLVLAPRRGTTVFALTFLLASVAAHVSTPAAGRLRAAEWEPVLLLYGTFGAGTLLPRWRPSI